MDPEVRPNYPDMLDVIQSSMTKEKPRIIKTHLSCEMMPTQFWEKGCKVRYN